MECSQLLDVPDGKDVDTCCAWFAARPDGWCDQVRWATLDRRTRIARCSTRCCRWLCRLLIRSMSCVVAAPRWMSAGVGCRTNCSAGHCGRNNDPLYRARQMLVMAAERLSVEGMERLRGLLAGSDPVRELWFAWNAKEIVRQIYNHTNPAFATAWVTEIARDFTDESMPFEVHRLGRTIRKWAARIVAWHHSYVSNGPTEAISNLVKRVKRISAFGFRRFEHYRIRALLYAGRPN